MTLGEWVQEVRASTRLVDSPACIVVGEHDTSANLARVLKAVGQEAPDQKPGAPPGAAPGERE